MYFRIYLYLVPELPSSGVEMLSSVDEFHLAVSERP